MAIMAILAVVAAYVAISIAIGIIDIYRICSDNERLSEFPQGDIGYYVMPREILGIHNRIFYPSKWIVKAAIRRG